ncbi:MAG TPA: zinc-binding dehydrogenase [Thermomicrobiales bacterium]|jgi:threonine dehydrogenase-like Zn-dependent dehydrogenase|nr:zinc-binding dehydrogenase [Thermomicrobiales bacterium]
MSEFGTGRSAVYRGTERNFDLVEHEVDAPKAGEVLLRMELSGICGTDVHIYETGTPKPMALGHENSGIVVAIGDGEAIDYTGRSVKVGDRVVPHPRTPSGVYGFRSDPESGPPYHTGGYGQYLALYFPDTAMYRIDAPANVAVLLEPLAVAVHAVERARIHIGDTVVVQGTGAIGLLTIFLAHRAGAANLIAVGGPKGRLEVAKALGADMCIDIEEITDPAERVKQVLAQTSGGAGADVVFECAGVKPAIAEGINYLRKSGTFCEVGHFVNTGEMTFNPNTQLVAKDITLVAPFGSGRDHFVRARAMMEKYQDQLSELVSHQVPMNRLQDAFGALLGRYHLDGRDAVKIAVDPWQ